MSAYLQRRCRHILRLPVSKLLWYSRTFADVRDLAPAPVGAPSAVAVTTGGVNGDPILI